jgi:dienelactone hydrolase
MSTPYSTAAAGLVALVLWAPVLGALTACDVPFAPAAADYAAELRARKGELEAVSSDVTGNTASHVIHDFRLTSTTGLEVRGRVRIPRSADALDPRPAVLILGGIERGGNAITLIRDSLPQVGAALWYPESLDADNAADALRNLETLKDVAWDIPAGVLLTLDYLATLPAVDPGRMTVVGASFGGFFIPAAAAADERVMSLGLLYTGGDVAGLMAAHLEGEIPPAAAVLGSELAALRLQQLEPIRYVGDIAPRPVLLVNGLHDDIVVRSSAEALIAATNPPKDVVWLPTEHLSAGKTELLQELVDTAIARLPGIR